MWRLAALTLCVGAAACVPPLAAEDMIPRRFELEGCHAATASVERATIEYSFRDPLDGEVLENQIEHLVEGRVQRRAGENDLRGTGQDREQLLQVGDARRGGGQRAEVDGGPIDRV